MRVPRTRGAFSGTLLVILGAWVALIPFVGPLFDYSIGSTAAWDWTMGRFWLNVLPGAVTMAAGFVILGAGRRGSIGLAAWAASLAGLWIICGPQVSRMWNDGAAQSGAPQGGTGVQVLEMLGYSLLAGGLITAIGALVLGRSTVASVADLRYDADIRDSELSSVGDGVESVTVRDAVAHDRPRAERGSGRHIFHRRHEDNVGLRDNESAGSRNLDDSDSAQRWSDDAELHHVSHDHGRRD
ncbi:MAG: hypothetical protein WBA45_13010 [Microthrixaceae bacterium]